MGHRLADTLQMHLDGEFDDDLDLNEDFARRTQQEVVVDVVPVEDTPSDPASR